ncbi:Kynureninase (L-kynurenine hydrolase) [Recurvomyces mirabilis]|nr:Kynureninase (L-kynurenine hydrolase) [Recurvomyces mirabilis]
MKAGQAGLDHARNLDQEHGLLHLRDNFHIPTKAELLRKTAKAPEHQQNGNGNEEPSIYLCGNSLGLQPLLTKRYFQQYLDTWATKGVYGHFTDMKDTDLVPWLHVDDDCKPEMASIVGALPDEVAIMQTLTANLHLMMASFYRPTKERFKIIIERKAFPSDHYAVESHLAHHNLDPATSMILIDPPSTGSLLLTTEHILSTIDKHAPETALLLLPGIQFYTGQYFDMKRITAHAQSKGIIVGWDLAHAVGNVPMQLHDWNVDFAAWCTYKYLNCGPGSIGGCFVHERHGKVEEHPPSQEGGEPMFDYRPRLSGWWGSSKSSRFAMTNRFHPIPGAGGFQLSNTSVADSTAVKASLDVFKQTSIEALREKSLKLTKYLEESLDALAQEMRDSVGRECFSQITPREAEQRGAQISVLLDEGLLEHVMEALEKEGVVLDERKPDVIRVAPAPLYNTFEDVFRFIEAFREALGRAVDQQKRSNGSVMVDGGREAKGWSEIK